jgi:dCMP deaminase
MGIPDEGLEIRSIKYPRIIHAEQNAILFAKRDLTDCTIYVWPLVPCSTCAGIIIQSGISRVVVANPAKGIDYERWKESNEIALEMFNHVNITVDFI